MAAASNRDLNGACGWLGVEVMYFYELVGGQSGVQTKWAGWTLNNYVKARGVSIGEGQYIWCLATSYHDGGFGLGWANLWNPAGAPC